MQTPSSPAEYAALFQQFQNQQSALFQTILQNMSSGGESALQSMQTPMTPLAAAPSPLTLQPPSTPQQQMPSPELDTSLAARAKRKRSKKLIDEDEDALPTPNFVRGTLKPEPWNGPSEPDLEKVAWIQPLAGSTHLTWSDILLGLHSKLLSHSKMVLDLSEFRRQNWFPTEWEQERVWLNTLKACANTFHEMGLLKWKPSMQAFAIQDKWKEAVKVARKQQRSKKYVQQQQQRQGRETPVKKMKPNKPKHAGASVIVKRYAPSRQQVVWISAQGECFTLIDVIKNETILKLVLDFEETLHTVDQAHLKSKLRGDSVPEDDPNKSLGLSALAAGVNMVGVGVGGPGQENGGGQGGQIPVGLALVENDKQTDEVLEHGGANGLNDSLEGSEVDLDGSGESTPRRRARPRSTQGGMAFMGTLTEKDVDEIPLQLCTGPCKSSHCTENFLCQSCSSSYPLCFNCWRDSLNVHGTHDWIVVINPVPAGIRKGIVQKVKRLVDSKCLFLKTRRQRQKLMKSSGGGGTPINNGGGSLSDLSADSPEHHASSLLTMAATQAEMLAAGAHHQHVHQHPVHPHQHAHVHSHVAMHHHPGLGPDPSVGQPGMQNVSVQHIPIGGDVAPSSAGLEYGNPG